VKFVPAISSETVIADQVNGHYDITGGNYVSYIQAQQSHRANLDIFAEGSVLQQGAIGIYTMPGSPIKTLGELKGRTVAINAPRNILYLLAASVLTEHGMSPANVHFVIAKDGFPAMPAELKAGAFNAAVFAEPFGSVAEEADGAVPLADFDQGATTSFPVEGFVVTKQWAHKYPRTLAAFYQALEEGQEIADTDRSAGGPARAARLVQDHRGDHVPGELPVQLGSSRQRGQGAAAARGRRHATVHRVPGVQHRFDADRRLSRRAGLGSRGGGSIQALAG
jgi:NitT/TauT family transport system substrate-binding protein